MTQKLLEKLQLRLNRPHRIIGQERYFNSAVMVPLVELEGELHFLFQERSPHIHQGGEVCFPGGRIDPSDPDSQAAALRETCEELGILEDQVEVLGFLGTLVAPMGVTVEAYLGVLKIANLQELHPEEEEVARLFTLPLSYFLAQAPDHYHSVMSVSSKTTGPDGQEIELLPVKRLGLPERYLHTWGGKKIRVLVYETPEGVIWGITGEIIHEIAQLLG